LNIIDKRLIGSKKAYYLLITSLLIQVDYGI